MIEQNQTIYVIVAENEIVDASFSRPESIKARLEYARKHDKPTSEESSRLITNEELCNLPANWENSKITKDYTDSALEVYEVTETLYHIAKRVGDRCQKHNGKYYIV